MIARQSLYITVLNDYRKWLLCHFKTLYLFSLNTSQNRDYLPAPLTNMFILIVLTQNVWNGWHLNISGWAPCNGSWQVDCQAIADTAHVSLHSSASRTLYSSASVPLPEGLKRHVLRHSGALLRQTTVLQASPETGQNRERERETEKQRKKSLHYWRRAPAPFGLTGWDSSNVLFSFAASRRQESARCSRKFRLNRCSITNLSGAFATKWRKPPTNVASSCGNWSLAGGGKAERARRWPILLPLPRGSC